MTAYTLPTAFTTSCGLLVKNDYNTFFRFPSKNTFWMLFFSLKTAGPQEEKVQKYKVSIPSLKHKLA